MQDANAAAATTFLNQLQASASENVVEAQEVIPMPDGAFPLSLEDVAPAPDEGTYLEVKNSKAFLVEFRAERKGKMKIVKGSREAADLIFAVDFSVDRGPEETSEEDAPKRRGRKPKTEKRSLRIKLYDDAGNKASAFLDTLYGKDDFETTVYLLSEAGERLSSFTFSGCSLDPLVVSYSLVNNDASEGRPLTIPLVISYSEFARNETSGSDE